MGVQWGHVQLIRLENKVTQGGRLREYSEWIIHMDRRVTEENSSIIVVV